MAFGSLKIARGDVYLVEIPVNSVRHHGSGAVASSKNTLLRLETTDGIVGWGEAAPWSVFTGTAEGCASALSRYLVPTLKGVDATQIAACMDLANHTIVGHPEAKAAFETALLDIVGKANGVPVHALLGGACRTEIPLSVSNTASPTASGSACSTRRAKSRPPQESPATAATCSKPVSRTQRGLI